MRWEVAVWLDDLLLERESRAPLSDSGVTGVTEGTPSNGAGFHVTPDDLRGVTEVTADGGDGDFVTPVTPADFTGLQPQAAPELAVPRVTPVTPQNGNVEGDAAKVWRLHFSDSRPVEVWVAPPATKAGIRAAYPDAREAVPLHQGARTATACRTCRHLHQPGRADPGYCAARDDLAHTYGAGHPLRRLPDDRGAACGVWANAEAME